MGSTETFQLKGSLFTLTVLKLKSIDFETLTKELETTIKQAPKFFANSPIAIDLQPLSQLALDVDFDKLINICRASNLIPIGVRNGNPDQHQNAVKAGLAVLPNIQTQETTETPKASTQTTQNASTAPEAVIAKSPTRIVTEPVRSGKQVYAEGGDLLILAPVSNGAEVIADGNIHVYGPLRGRALAGVQGDNNARIFCSELDAELVSIAGHYKVSEEIKTSGASQTEALTHVYLDDGELHIASV